MRRVPLAILIPGIILACSSIARAVEPPSTITPDGGMPLPRAAQATRVDFLGLVDLYDIALYADGPVRDRARLLSPDVAKVLRMEIKYEDDLRRQVALDWRRELVPRLPAAATAHLRGAFAPLQRGNVVLVEYVPGRGTTVRIDKGVAVTAANHDLMLIFLDHWIGQRPVSEEIKQTLLAGS